MAWSNCDAPVTAAAADRRNSYSENGSPMACSTVRKLGRLEKLDFAPTLVQVRRIHTEFGGPDIEVARKRCAKSRD